jgi:hypothetical protein
MAIKPKLTVNIFERDLGFSHFLREAKKIRAKPYVKVGVTQKRGSKLREDGKKTIADVAQIHEFGAPQAGIPERSFLRSTVNDNGGYEELKRVLVGKIFDATAGMTVERALGLIGQTVTRDVKARIRDGIAPALKAATIRAKNAGLIGKAKGKIASLEGKDKLSGRQAEGFLKAKDLVETGGESTPLIDTAQMINAVSYEVVKDGSSESGQDGGSA